jgi:hypothetical protein
VSITEQDRIRLHNYFEEAMGEDLAPAMMACLPPTGWGDLATKQDLRREIGDVQKEVHHFGEVFDLKLTIMEANLMHRFQRELRLQTLALGALITVFSALRGIL